MFTKLFVYLMVIIFILCIGLSQSVKAIPHISSKTIYIPESNKTKTNKNELKNTLTYVQVCSCRSYYGIPHTCYFSPVTDPYRSCFVKCVREANQ